MKRISLLALAMAVAVTVSCSKAVAPQNEDTTPGEPIAFEAGQEVTLTVGTGIGTGTFTDTASSDVLATASSSISGASVVQTGIASGVSGTAGSISGGTGVQTGTATRASAVSDERFTTISCGKNISLTLPVVSAGWDDDGTATNRNYPSDNSKGEKSHNAGKIGSTRVTSTFDASSGISFAWETGDQIKVTVGGKSSVFTLTGTPGATATFKGNMPASGTTFSVQYPVTDITDADLATQTYVAGGVQKDKLQFSATGCTLGSAINLTTVQSVLRLNFYGTSVTLDSVVVTNTTASTKYKLDGCASAGVIGAESSGATPFLIVVTASSGVSFTAQTYPHGGGSGVTPGTYHEETSSYSGPGIPIPVGTDQTSFSTSSKTFAAGSVLNMASKEIKAANVVIWAPVNCGYDATNYPYGKLYQWGRKVGGGYNTASGATTDIAQSATAATYTDNYNKSPEDSKFYYQASEPYDWYTNSSGTQLSAWPMKSTDSGYVADKIANPCPSGWRVPTYYELTTLLNCTSSSTATSTWSATSPIPGRTFYGNKSKTGNSLFLPAAGYRYYDFGNAYNRGSYGSYWSSSVIGTRARCLYFYSGGAGMGSGARAYGYSVRCVQE